MSIFKSQKLALMLILNSTFFSGYVVALAFHEGPLELLWLVLHVPLIIFWLHTMGNDMTRRMALTAQVMTAKGQAELLIAIDDQGGLLPGMESIIELAKESLTDLEISIMEAEMKK